MNAKLADLLKKGDRIAVSNITGREASKVSEISQKYCGNVMGGWALGKGGQKLHAAGSSIPVYATFEELLKLTAPENYPNKILIYSPPDAVYGDIKSVVKFGTDIVDTIFVVTENVSIEVTAKINLLCQQAGIVVLGCNTLGMINVHDRVRIGAVGGDDPAETFHPGSVTVISNSGNMVNTISSYLLSVGMGTSFGISTGKDRLILFPLKNFIKLAVNDQNTRILVLYIEPGGVYEYEAIELMKKTGFSKPVVVFVAGSIAEKHNISLGHAGAVVEGERTSATGKQKLFDEYFGSAPFVPEKRYKKNPELKETLSRGIRVTALHHIPKAVALIANHLDIKKDKGNPKSMRLNPWFVNLGDLGKRLPVDLSLSRGHIPQPYKSQIEKQSQAFLSGMIRQPMRNASHSSSNDGRIPRIYGYSLMEIMRTRSFTAALILYWTGELPTDEFEEKIAEMTLIASLTNGPGTISAQGAKLSTSAGNSPNTAMIATLATLGLTHGGNGAKAVKYLIKLFEKYDLADPYDSSIDVKKIARAAAEEFRDRKLSAKEAGGEYEKIPCLGHPVFKNDDVNYDPRERVIHAFIEESGKVNVFLEFYHHLARNLKENKSTSRVMAVNLDASIACVWLGICWTRIKEKHMTIQRAVDIPFIAFAFSRAGGGAGEFLDHQDFGTNMDMRIPVSECKTLTRPRKPEKI